MSKVKATAGLLVGIGGPTLFAVIAISVISWYTHQHIHDRTATILNDHHATVHVSDYHHSGAGIAAVAAVVGLAWIAVTVFFILLGGWMYEARNRKWY